MSQQQVTPIKTKGKHSHASLILALFNIDAIAIHITNKKNSLLISKEENEVVPQQITEGRRRLRRPQRAKQAEVVKPLYPPPMTKASQYLLFQHLGRGRRPAAKASSRHFPNSHSLNFFSGDW
ncbi:hypothetical protein V6N11_076591 [Hibiscus sabdariffa]|uniref:Uncharacterized protein n=1 Tax=Hibiscus sabdariffa TaxID=183260 RepID=A0ABR2Q6Q4_9ROSI